MAHQSTLRVEFSSPLTPVQAHGGVLGFTWLEIVKVTSKFLENNLGNTYHGDPYFKGAKKNKANRSILLSL